MPLSRKIFSWLFSPLLISVALAKRPGLDKVTWETERFLLTIDRQKASILQEMAPLLESSLTEFEYFFDFRVEKKIQCVFLDEDDIANGYALAAKGWVVIYMPGAQFHLRGPTAWLPNVVTHELAHIVTLRKMGNLSTFFQFSLSFQYFTSQGDFSAASLNVPYHNVPPWLAEGLAQYGAMIVNRDTIDSHRTMLLRTAATENRLMSLGEMEAFAWDSRRNEQIYNQGFFFVDFLYRKFGPGEMNDMMKSFKNHSLATCFRKVFGRSLQDLYEEWMGDTKNRYVNAESEVSKPLFKKPFGIPWLVEGSPVRSGDGQVAFLSSRHNDHGLTHLYIKKGKRVRKVFNHVSGPLKLRPDGNAVLFMSKKIIASRATLTSDLYLYEFSTRKVKRLTKNARVFSAAWDEHHNIYVLTEDGGRTPLSKLEKGEVRRLALPGDGTEWRNISRGPGNSLFVEMLSSLGTDIYSLDLASLEATPILATSHDEKHPYLLGEELFFSADYEGKYDIYSLKEGQIRRYSDVSGGAFFPFSSENSLYFSIYESSGYRIKVSEKRPEIIPVNWDTAGRVPSVRDQKVSVRRGGWNQTKLSLVGWGAMATAGKLPLFQLTLDSSEIVLDEFFASAGGAGYWLNPSNESEVFAQMAGLTSTTSRASEFYGGLGSVQYINRLFLPTLTFNSNLLWLRVRPHDTDGLDEWDLMLFELITDMTFQLSREWLNSTQVYYAGGTIRQLGSSLSLGIGNFWAYQFVEPGEDRINRGVAFSLGGSMFPAPPTGIYVPQVQAGLFYNFARYLFLEIRTQTSLLLGNLPEEIESSHVNVSQANHLKIPLDLRIPFWGRSNLFFDKAWLFNDVSWEPKDRNSVDIGALATNMNNFPHRILQNSELPSSLVDPNRYGFFGTVGLRIKMISPVKNAVHWNFYITSRLDTAAVNPTWGVQISM